MSGTSIATPSSTPAAPPRATACGWPAGIDGDGPFGYVIHGRASSTGYVQRLAVRPEDSGKGWGTALVLDGLRWMAAGGCVEALVNTHTHNARALALYEHLGFVRLPDGLVVLGPSLLDESRLTS